MCKKSQVPIAAIIDFIANRHASAVRDEMLNGGIDYRFDGCDCDEDHGECMACEFRNALEQEITNRFFGGRRIIKLRGCSAIVRF